VAVPIVPGLLPIITLNQVKRITSMCGSTIPPELLARLEAAGTDENAALEVGVRQAVDQALGLLKGGAPGIHFYVLNKDRHMARIMKEVRPALEALDASGSRSGAHP
jgi:methylenetetrahydrofolate reductase (NADPH)